MTVVASPAFQPPTPDDITRAVMAGVAAPVDEDLWERRMRALTLRNQGKTFAEIAERLVISPTVARADVRHAMREVLSESIEDGIARQISVLRDMQHGAYPLALQGDKDSIMAIVRCLEQEAKLKALYAPTRAAAGISDIDFAEQAAKLFEILGANVPKELSHGRAAIEAGLGPAVNAGINGAVAADLARRRSQSVDASEIVDGIVERFAWPAGGLGFDIPAFDLEIDAEPHFIDGASADIGDSAISAAAAAAIDPEQFGDVDDHQNTTTQSQGGASSDGNGQPGRWSNL